MRARQTLPGAIAAGLLVVHAAAASQGKQSNDINDYLVDIGAGPVSAADLIGVSSTAVTNVQSLKDFNVLFTPGTGSEQQTGMGLQLAPFRTRWSPISAQEYHASAGARLLGALSLSYAQNQAKYNNLDYRQQAAALHVAYYVKPEDDPIYVAYDAFINCTQEHDATLQMAEGVQKATTAYRKALAVDRPLTAEELETVKHAYEATADFAKLKDTADQAVKQCVASRARDNWNATLLTATIGGAWIRPNAGGGSTLTLARSLSLAGVFYGGANGAFNVLARFNRHELDLDTLAGAPAYKDRTLLAARYTYRGAKDSTLYGLAEVSNAKSSEATISDSAFKYALGLDAKLFDAVWLEFRVGRARSSNSSSGDATKGLLSLKWSPTPTLPTLFSKE
jgi:hypothetical protein